MLGSCCQPGDSWHSKGQRKHSQKRKLLQDQVIECGSTILCSVVLYALIVWLHFDIGILWRQASLPRVPTRFQLANQISYFLNINQYGILSDAYQCYIQQLHIFSYPCGTSLLKPSLFKYLVNVNRLITHLLYFASIPNISTFLNLQEKQQHNSSSKDAIQEQHSGTGKSSSISCIVVIR